MLFAFLLSGWPPSLLMAVWMIRTMSSLNSSWEKNIEQTQLLNVIVIAGEQWPTLEKSSTQKSYHITVHLSDIEQMRP